MSRQGSEGLKPGWTRVSFPYCMSNEEFEFVLAAIKFIAMYGERFLPLYHFNWRNGNWVFRKSSIKGITVTNELGLGLSKIFGGANEIAEVKEGNMSIKDERVPKVINQYTSYLESAKFIAYSLPRIPPQRKVPDDIDLSLVLFRI